MTSVQVRLGSRAWPPSPSFSSLSLLLPLVHDLAYLWRHLSVKQPQIACCSRLRQAAKIPSHVPSHPCPHPLNTRVADLPPVP